MKEDRTLTAEEKLALVQLIGISSTVKDVKRHIGSYLKNNVLKEENPPIREDAIIPEKETTEYNNEAVDTIKSNVNISDTSIYDSKYLDIVKEDLARQKPNTDERKTEIVNEPEIIVTNEVNTEPVIEKEEPDISVNERYGYLTEEELFGDREKEAVKEVKTQVLEKKTNPWEGLRTVTPGEK